MQGCQSTQLGKLHKIPGSNPLNHLKIRQANGANGPFGPSLEKPKKFYGFKGALRACGHASAIVIVPVRRRIVQRKTESAFGISTLARECLLGRKGSKKSMTWRVGRSD